MVGPRLLVPFIGVRILFRELFACGWLGAALSCTTATASNGVPREPGPARTVVVLAAGEGKRMKSATPKVLHPLLGRTLLGHVLAAAGAAAGRAARSWWSGTRPTRSRRTCRGGAGRGAGAAGAAERHRARGPDRARGGAGRCPAPSWCSTATCRCCGRRPWRRWSLAHEAAKARRDRAGRRGGRPDRAGPDRAGRGRQPGADRRGAGRARPRSGRSGRSTPGSTRSTPRCCGRRWASCPPTTTRARST